MPRGVSYQSDVEPLYGNPIVFGALQVSGASPVSGSSFLVVWMTKSAGHLDALVRGFPGLTAEGTAHGATLYQAGSMTLAVDGATAVIGSSRGAVEAALTRHARGGGISTAEFSNAMTGLPRNTLFQGFGMLTGILSSATKVPWIAAIRTYALSLSATSTGVSAQFRLDTSGVSLTSSELPIAPGTAAPGLAGALPIAAGVRDPAHVIAFVEMVERAVDPAAFARFARRQAAARRKAGYDLNTFAGLLTGNLIVQSDARTTMGRADVTDPTAAARELARLPQVVRDVLPAARRIGRQPGGFYAVEEGHGRSLEIGLVGHELVAGLAPPARLRAFATAPTVAVPGAQGSASFRVGLLELVRAAVRKALNPLLEPVLARLGDVTGSASATPGALAGHLTLSLR